MTNKTRTKGQTPIYKILHRKLKIEHHELDKKTKTKTGGLMRSGTVSSSCKLVLVMNIVVIVVS